VFETKKEERRKKKKFEAVLSTISDEDGLGEGHSIKCDRLNFL